MVKKNIYVMRNRWGMDVDFVKKNGKFYEVMVGYVGTKKSLMAEAKPYMKRAEQSSKDWGVRIDTLICETKKGWCVAAYAPDCSIGVAGKY